MSTSQYVLLQALLIALIGPCSWEFVSAASKATDPSVKDYPDRQVLDSNDVELQKVSLLSTIAKDLQQQAVLKKKVIALEDIVEEKKHELEVISKLLGCPIGEVISKIEDMKDRREALDKVVLAATDEVLKSHGIIEILKAEIAQKEKELEDYTTETTQLHDDLSKQLTYMETELQSQQIKQQNEKIERFNKRAVMKQERIKIQRLEDEVSFGVEMKDSFRKSISFLEREKKEIQKEVARLKVALHERRAADNEGETIGIPIDNLSDLLFNKTIDLEFRKREETLSRVVAELSIDNSKLNLKIRELQDEVSKAELKAKSEETALTRLQQELIKEMELREQYEQELKEKQEEVDRLNFAMNVKKSFLYSKSMPSSL